MENKLNWFGKVLEWVDKYGLWKIIKGGFGFIFISYVIIISTNPGIIYDKVVSYIETIHNTNQVIRQEADLKVRYILKDLLNNTNADRAWVIEYHNGTSGLGGLPFTYGIMNSEETEPGVASVSSHYKDFLLSDYLFILETSKKGGWFGDVEDIKELDRRMYYTFKSNDVNKIAIFYLKSEDRDIGILGLSYCDNEMPVDTWVKLRDAGIKVSIILNK